MKILIAASESVPYAKTGGLADVTGALLKEYRNKKIDASLILPLYAGIKAGFKLFNTGKTVRIPAGNGSIDGTIWVSDKSENPAAYFIESDQLFGRDELYGTPDGEYRDNALRFIFFSRAVIETCLKLHINPDVIHCNDWQTGMIPLYLKTIYRSYKHFSSTASLFTIHNLGYQGNFEASNMIYTGLGMDYFTPERLEFYGNMNLMKAGLLYADIINTVSVTYAKEILEPDSGFGLDGVIRKRAADLYGIINGIDFSEWNPSRDSNIPKKFSKYSINGKSACKALLLRKTGLKNTIAPLVGFVGRLSSQKGLDLILNSVDELLSLGINLVILGRGDDYYQKAFMQKATEHRSKLHMHIGFDENFAHLIYAGSDFFLMPSQYEPCGLGQLVAMKYGSIPIARRTGGLADTVMDFNHITCTGTGFLFSDYSESALQDAIKRALCVYGDKTKMRTLIHNSMKQDFSWKRSAEKYIEIYRKAIRKVSV